jgi:cytochrome c-type biogenesis protein CcmH
MPLAIMRSTVRELPVQFSLDDSSAMSPTMKLSAFDKVVVVARVSRSGNPAPQKGDLEGVTSEMAPRARGLKVEISSTIN